MGTHRFFTSESVTEGHPDKMADRISDAILDAILAQDPWARVACETMVTTGLVLVVGEITTTCYVEIPQIVRRTVNEIGYTRAKFGFDGDTCAVLTSIDEQSPDIARGVDEAWEARQGADDPLELMGAGDQGMMFGYACRETPEFMPLPISLAHRLCRRLAQVRKDKTLDYLRPDGKSQVTVEYGPHGPARVEAVVLGAQHHPDISLDKIRADLEETVIRQVIPASLIDEKTHLFINSTGRFVVGGPQGDSGLTGRKTMVDTYGSSARHGGGAYSGKDPTKVDRTGSYAARHAAKNLVAAGLARACEVQVAYAIGVSHPLSVAVDTFGTGCLPDSDLARLVSRVFDLRPGAIIRDMDLTRPIYTPLSAYGHFGRPDLDLPWEALDREEELRDACQGKTENPEPPEAG